MRTDLKNDDVVLDAEDEPIWHEPTPEELDADEELWSDRRAEEYEKRYGRYEGQHEFESKCLALKKMIRETLIEMRDPYGDFSADDFDETYPAENDSMIDSIDAEFATEEEYVGARDELEELAEYDIEVDEKHDHESDIWNVTFYFGSPISHNDVAAVLDGYRANYEGK